MVYTFKNKVSFYTLLSSFLMATAFAFPINAQAASPSFQRHFSDQNFQTDRQVLPVQYIDPRINDLEQKVRELNGTLEVLNHKMNQMQEEIKRLGGNGAAKTNEQAPSTSPIDSGKVVNPENMANPGKTEINDSATQQEGNLGTLKLDKTGDITGSTMDPNAQKSENYGETLETVPDTKTAEELLNLGKNYLSAHNYKAAESVFSVLPLRFPESNLTGQASFYLGDAFYAQGRHREAAQRYLAFYNQDPESEYQPENLLKLAKSMAALNDRTVACDTLSSITQKYETVDPKIMALIKEEQTQNKCH